jgi:hypothetical protein
LFGSLERENDLIDLIVEQKNAAVIHGISSDAKKVTLFNCYSWVSYNFCAPFLLTNYNCQFAVIGKYLISLKDLVFNKIQILSPQLSKWLHPGAIENVIHFKNENKIKKITYSVNTKNDTNLKFETVLAGGYKLTILGGSNINSTDDLLSVNLEQQTYFEIEFINNKTDLFTLYNKAQLFAQFISLATLSPIIFSRILFFDVDDFQSIENGEKYINSVELFRIERNEDFSRLIKRHDLLFDFSRIQNIFKDVIHEWFDKDKVIAPIRKHLIDSISSKSYFSSLDFLIVIQALEGFHRRFVNKSRMDLSERIEQLIDMNIEIDIISNCKINLIDVVNSRHYYSHFFPKEANVLPLDGRPLYILTKKLRVLLICCTLQIVGFDNETINDIIKSSNNIIVSNINE